MIYDTFIHSASNVYQEQEDIKFNPNEGIGTFTKDSNKFIISQSSRLFGIDDINRAIIITEGNYRNFILRIKIVVNTMEVIVDDNTVRASVYDVPFKMLKTCGLHYEDGVFALNMDSGHISINASKQEESCLQLHTSSNNTDVSSIEILHKSNGQINNKSMNIIHQTGELQASGVSIAHDIHVDDLDSNDKAVVRAISVSTTNRSGCMKDGIIINEGFTYPFYVYSNADKYVEPIIYLNYSTTLLFDTGNNYNYNKDTVVVKDGVVKLSGKEAHLLSKFSFDDDLIDSVSGIKGTFVCGTGQFVNGKIEKCVELVNKCYVKISDNRFITSSGTAGCWVNLYTTIGTQGLFRNGMCPDDSGYGLLSINGKLAGCWGTEIYNTDYNIVPNVWNHIVCTWTTTNLTVYVNGNNILSQNRIHGTTKNIIIIGVNKGITNSKSNMNGLIDEFFLSDRNMSDVDINGIYTSENKCIRLKYRTVNEEQYIDSKNPLNLTSFGSIQSYNIEFDKPTNTNISVYTSTDRTNWKIFDPSSIDCKSNIFLRIGMISRNILNTPRIRSCTLVSGLKKSDRYPIQLNKSSTNVILGSIQRFNTIRIMLETHQLNTSKIEAYYWSNSWVPLNTNDNTSNFDRSGTIIFIPPTDWIPTEIIDSYKIPKLYYLRLVYTNKYKIQCTINKIEISITDYTKDLFINKDCSLHLPLISVPDQPNCIYRDIEGRVSFYGSDGIQRSMTAFTVYSGEISEKITSSDITRITKIDPSKVEEGFHITFKETLSGINYLCTVFDKKWKTIAFL